MKSQMSPVKSYAWKIFLIILIASTAPNLLADVFVAGLNAIDRSHYASAYRSFKPLADEGISEAQNNMGFLYENGFGVKRNYTLAIKWYELAAKQGLPEAQHNMGMLNYQGYGVSQSFVVAKRWFNKSAKQDLRDSHYMLGLMFFKGEGTQESPVRASGHFLKAAKSGDPNALYMLAHMIISGDAESSYNKSSDRLSPFDFSGFTNKESNQLVAALSLSLLASKSGQSSAAGLVDFLKSQLDKESISTADSLSATCLATEYKDCRVF